MASSLAKITFRFSSNPITGSCILLISVSILRFSIINFAKLLLLYSSNFSAIVLNDLPIDQIRCGFQNEPVLNSFSLQFVYAFGKFFYWISYV
jgi:hypothetical protein